MTRTLRPKFLRRELLFRLMLPLLAIVVATAALGTYTAQRMTERVFDRWLLDAAHSVGSVVSFEQGHARLDLPPSAEKVLLFDDLDRTFFSVSQDGQLLAGKAGIPQDGTRELTYSRGRAYLSHFAGEAVRIARVDLAGPDGRDVVILVAETLEKRQRSEQELVAVFWPMAALIVAAGGAIMLAVRRTVRPLEVIAARWNERSHVSLQPIGDDDVPRELAPFAAALNSLLARIREMLARERQFAATAAHQLRTPLAGLQLGLARAAKAEDIASARLVLNELSSATQRTARLVQQLLILGRLDPEIRGELAFESCDLVGLAQDVGAAHSDASLAKRNDLELIEPGRPVMVEAAAELLAEALGNLIDNAIRYTPAGGLVLVEVLENPPGLRVSDSGPGIPAAEREGVFGRFVRGRDAEGQGSGLGLAIARDIAALHGAALTLTDAPLKGTCATFAFAERGRSIAGGAQRDSLASRGNAASLGQVPAHMDSAAEPDSIRPPLPAPALDMSRYVVIQLLVIPALLTTCALLLQYGPLDMDLAMALANPERGILAWHHAIWLDALGHHAANALPILTALAAVATGAAGFALPSLRPWRAILFTTAAAIVAGPLLVDFLKTLTTQHCPADLVEFGGPVRYAFDQSAPFWTTSTSLAGHCLPSGHAAGGYALLSLYFAGWAAGRPAWRWRGLFIGISAGILFSLVRMLQGAHFASSTMWSASIDWSVCALLFLPLISRSNFQNSSPQSGQ